MRNAQVTVEYDENEQPLRVDTVVISTQHDEAVDNATIHQDVMKKSSKQKFQVNF